MSRGIRSPDATKPSPPRIWTVEEANARIEGLGELLPQLKTWAVRLGEVHAELRRLAQFWGRDVDATDSPDRDLKTRLEAEWRNLSHRLEEAVSALQSEGIEVKDLETGLVDFYALREDQLVLLCWRRGEPEVSFFHTLEGGFRSRQPLPDDATFASSRPRTRT
ncbi:MAG: DUF2203 domain-containing protein [Thermoplasmata archaeon]|nr:DUF2203 domain-containing protein [Thermoplasmata archaeon]